MKRQKNIQQVKEHDKCTTNETKEEEIGNLPENEFRIMIGKMIQNFVNKTELHIYSLETRIEKMCKIFNKDLEKIKESQSIMNNAITEIKSTLDGVNSRITEAEDRISEVEDRISEVEDRMVEINEAERKKEKRIKRNEDNLRDPWDNATCPNIQIIGVPEEEDKKTGHEKLLEEIIVENFPKMEKEIVTKVQETQRVPNRVNLR